MIIATDQQVIVFPPTVTPEMVLPYIATAKVLHYQGHDLVVVPHAMDETRVLRNMGVEVPSPIGFYYDWPKLKGIYDPFHHQRETSGFLTLNKRAYVLNEIGCVDSATEYLSPTGWRRMDQYDGGQVAQYNLDGTAEFVQPTEYVKKPCAEMIHLSSPRGVDQLLSPEHRVLYRQRRTNEWQVISAADLARRHGAARYGFEGGFETTFKMCGAGTGLTLAEVRLMVAIAADGSFPKGTVQNYCVFGLVKQRKKERLRALLTESEIEWREVNDGKNTRFTFRAPLRIKVFGERFYAADAVELQAIVEELSFWDGHRPAARPNEWKFFSCEEASIGFVQYAACATGWRTTVLRVPGKNENQRDVFILTATKRTTIGIAGRRAAKNISLEPSPDGFKYCFMVPSTFLVFRRNGCVFVSGNTGKTQSALWAADYLMKIGAVRKALIIAPLSCLERVWADAVFESFPHRKSVVLHGNKASRLKKLADDSADFLCINHDGVEIICDVKRDPKKKTVLASKLLRDDIDLIIVDETAVYRNAQTDRYRVLKKAVRAEHWIWGLSGAPIPEAPTDAWAQCRLITPETVPEFFTQFRNTTMAALTQYKWIPRKEATEIVYKAMQPAVRFSRDQCLDLPELMPPSERACELSAEQTKHYREITNQLVTEVKGRQIKAVNEGVKRMKLLQVVCGTLYAEQFDEKGVKLKERAVLEIDCASRLKVLRETIEECGQKVIVFAPFSATLDMIYREMSKHWTCALVYGATPKGQRDQTFSDFQARPDPHVLIADAGTMAHGLTLTEASTCIWYAPIDSNDNYTQANGRITRPGQKNVQNIIHICATAVERRIYKRLAEKENVQGVLLEMVEDGTLGA